VVAQILRAVEVPHRAGFAKLLTKQREPENEECRDDIELLAQRDLCESDGALVGRLEATSATRPAGDERGESCTGKNVW